MNARLLLLLLMCAVCISGKCNPTNPPDGAEKIELVGRLDLNQSPNDIEAYADENYVYIYFHRSFGNVSLSLYNATGLLVYSDVVNTTVQQTVIIPITGTVDGTYTLVLENVNGYIEGEFENGAD